MSNKNLIVTGLIRRHDKRAVDFDSSKSLILPRLPVGLMPLFLPAVFLLVLSVILTQVSAAQTPTPPADGNVNRNAASVNNPPTVNTNTSGGTQPAVANTVPPIAAPPQNVQPEPPDYHDRVIVQQVYNSLYKDAENSDKREAGLNDIIIVRVENLEELVKWSDCKGTNQPKPCEPKEIVLYINGREISGLEPESGAPKLDTVTDGNENPTENTKPLASNGELRYHLQRITDTPESDRDNSEHWSDLLGLRFDNYSGSQEYVFSFDKWRRRKVEVSVGLAGEYPVRTKVKTDAKKLENQFWLVRLRGYWLILWLGILVFILGGLIWLTIKRDLLRDRSVVLIKENQPYSLSSFQAAWWFAIVLLSFMFIWLVTGQNDFSPTALILVSIGLGTTLGASIIDVSKRNASSNANADNAPQPGSDQLKKLLMDKAALETDPDVLKKGTQAYKNYEDKIYEIKMNFPNAIGPSSKSFLNDILSDINGINFHRFQLFVWTIILGLFFIISALGRLAMPQFSETLLALMGISAGAFLGLKGSENSSMPVPPAAAGNGNSGGGGQPNPNPSSPGGQDNASSPGEPASCVIEPVSGSTNGGETATISKTGFESVKSVMFGDTAADFSIDEAFVITTMIPAHAAETVRVIIESGEGKKAQTDFTYTAG